MIFTAEAQSTQSRNNFSFLLRRQKGKTQHPFGILDEYLKSNPCVQININATKWLRVFICRRLSGK